MSVHNVLRGLAPLVVVVQLLLCAHVAAATLVPVRAADIYPGPGSSSPVGIQDEGLIEYEHSVYFAAEGAGSGREMWRSDGTAEGTVLVKDIGPDSDSCSPPRDFTVLGDYLYFTGCDAERGRELWRTDGTATGTVPVTDIAPGDTSSTPLDLTTVGDELYFSAFDGQSDRELWRTDGTPAGTVLVKNINPGDASHPEQLTALGNRLYFTADDGTSGRELWRTDGTPAGTVLVKDINPGGASADVSAVTVFGEGLFFWGGDGETGVELWRTDGTDAGTVLVKDINRGSESSSPSGFTPLGDRLYFAAEANTSGRELWRTDGTAAGTVLVKDIDRGPDDSWPGRLTAFGGKLYFGARTHSRGDELWRTDGSAAGTVLVRDINRRRFRGTGYGSSPTQFTALGNRLYFEAEDFRGREVWQTDGTAEGTMLTANAVRGEDGLEPTSLTPFGGTLLFAGTSFAEGTELWRLTNAPRLRVKYRRVQVPRRLLQLEVRTDMRTDVFVWFKLRGTSDHGENRIVGASHTLSAALESNVPRTLRLELTRVDLRAASAWLEDGLRVRVKVRVKVTGPEGNIATEKASIRFERTPR